MKGAPPKYKELLILNTIDQLRKRKARPDKARICHMLHRRHGASEKETEAHLESLVDSGVILKVDYKGNTSYRNATKWRENVGGHVLNSDATSQKITEAMKCLTSRCDGATKKSASVREIEKWLIDEKEETHLVKATLTTALSREVQFGTLERLASGNYILSNKPTAQKAKSSATLTKPGSCASVSSKSNSTVSSPVDDNGVEEMVQPKTRGRPPSKRKRIKKTHGPDFETIEIKKKQPKRASSSGSEANTDDESIDGGEDKCDFCLSARFNGKKEYLLKCTDCKAKAHPSCMSYSRELAKKARHSPWQCIDCKTCYICEDAEDPDAMLFCDSCDKGYHMACHNPPVRDKPKGKWVCTPCSGDASKRAGNSESEDDINGSQMSGGISCLPTPCASPTQNVEEEYFKQLGFHQHLLNRLALRRYPFDCYPRLPRKTKTEDEEEKYPDASEWTIHDVVNFFKEKGFEQQSTAFVDQEIDGKSLLLMKRNDVLTGLSIKLGPALKMYEHIQKLQTACWD